MIKRFGRTEGVISLILPAITYATLAAAIFYSMWPYFYHIKNETLIVLGAVGIWRYSWLTLNYIRSSIYNSYYYPRLKRRVASLAEEKKYPDHIFFIIPSFREEAWVTVETFQSIFSNLATVPCKATLIVATGSDQDDAVISSVYNSHLERDKVELILQRQHKGKRIAMGHALRAASRRYVEDENSVTIFMDGDSYLESFALAQTLPFFSAFPDLGALTTNEAAYINTRSQWYKDWFNLKFGQRHVLFKSHALSNKVLTLTGRFSMFRTDIVLKSDFIEKIENDIITHWMHGKFRFLMGDDKSSWFYLLKHGWNMLYIPDVTCYSLESRDASFKSISISLPYRWYGNTLRNNNRALKLGWRKTGLFIWFAILDQRLSMWTSLVGISGAIILTAIKSFVYLPFYLAWVLSVRVIQMSVIAFRGHPVTLRTIPLMLFNQWVGAVVKIRAYHHLADQKWSKGDESQSNENGIAMISHKLVKYMPRIMMVLSYGVFFFALLLAEGAVVLPDLDSVFNRSNVIVIDARQHGVKPDDDLDDAHALRAIISHTDPTKLTIIQLPRGVIDFHVSIPIHKNNLIIEGKGKDKTLIRSHLRTPDKAVFLVEGVISNTAIKLTAPLMEDDKRLLINDAENIRKNDFLLLKMPNEEGFLSEIKSEVWKREYPWVRQSIVRVEKVSKNKLSLEYPTGLVYQPEITRVQRIDPVRNITLRDFSLRQVIPNAKISDVEGDYTNSYPNYAADGIQFKYVVDSRIERVKLVATGRHPVHWESSYACRAGDLEIDGSWNKGKSGNGYVRISRSHHNEFTNSKIKNIRHITLQWSSSYNRISYLTSEVDINFHGGYSHHNRVRNIIFNLPATHKWTAISQTPNDARWAPPDGQGNIVSAIRINR
ncbi:MAG: glycosyltransferase [Methylococcales bacterium]